VAPEVLLRKLNYLRQLLTDLTPHANATLAEVQAEHYKLERLLELLVVAASDILHHELLKLGVEAKSYRETFGLAAEQDLIPADLAARLQDAAGMRNIIVHVYEKIDTTILRDSLAPALRDFEQFVATFEQRLAQE
jgi:uncharacterized protein YutE (UPF0331/DUF86 family)